MVNDILPQDPRQKSRVFFLEEEVMGLITWLKERWIEHSMIKNRRMFQKDPIVYSDCIDYKISPDTVKNKLIRAKAFKVWIRLWDMIDKNRLRMSGTVMWRGAKIDLMKDGELTNEEYQSASALWFGLFSIMYDDCKERYYNGEASF